MKPDANGTHHAIFCALANRSVNTSALNPAPFRRVRNFQP